LTPSFGVSLLIAYSVSVSFLFTLTLFLKVEITIPLFEKEGSGEICAGGLMSFGKNPLSPPLKKGGLLLAPLHP
jgi:hypothetical protein